jgi:hypothetical protein
MTVEQAETQLRVVVPIEEEEDMCKLCKSIEVWLNAEQVRHATHTDVVSGWPER